MEINHIEITSGVCGGKPHVSGHRIRVQDIVVWHEKFGLSVDEIIIQYPSLNFADIYASLAYYHDNKEKIDHDIAQENIFSNSFRRENTSKLKAKLNKDLELSPLSFTNRYNTEMKARQNRRAL